MDLPVAVHCGLTNQKSLDGVILQKGALRSCFSLRGRNKANAALAAQTNPTERFWERTGMREYLISAGVLAVAAFTRPCVVRRPPSASLSAARDKHRYGDRPLVDFRCLVAR